MLVNRVYNDKPFDHSCGFRAQDQKKNEIHRVAMWHSWVKESHAGRQREPDDLFFLFFQQHRTI